MRDSVACERLEQWIAGGPAVADLVIEPVVDLQPLRHADEAVVRRNGQEADSHALNGARESAAADVPTGLSSGSAR
jgi:hypothetical protein